MNAPIEQPVVMDRRLRQAADASRLAQRLRAECAAMCCSIARRAARYATDASIYQIVPDRRRRSARRRRRCARALAVARELDVPVLPRGAGSSQCGQTVGAGAGRRSQQVASTASLAFDKRRDDGHRRSPASCSISSTPVCSRTACGSRSTSARRRRRRIGGMAGNNSCGSRSIALRQHGAQRRRHRRACSPTAARLRVRSRRRDVARRSRVRELRRRAAQRSARASATRSSAGSARAAPRRRLQPRRVRAAKRAPVHGRRHRSISRICWSAREGTLAYFARAHAAARAAAGASRARRREFPVASIAAMECDAAHRRRSSPPAVELVDRTMIDLARGNPAFRAGDRRAR